MYGPADVRVLTPVVVLKEQVVPDQLIHLLTGTTVATLTYHETPE